MNLNLITLNTQGKLEFDINPDMSAYKDDRIISLDRIHVSGVIIDNGTEEYEVKFKIDGSITLKSSINNSPVPFNLDINYDDFITNLVENYKNGSNSLDILPIIWENILLEIPIRAVNEDDKYEKSAGEGWEILDIE